MIDVTPYLRTTRIAYFSMEIGLRPEMHTYSGGLGILAGDAARSAADLGLPMVFVTLASRSGYLHQDIDSQGAQVDNPDPWNPEDYTEPVGVMAAVPIEGRTVWIRPWLYELKSPLGRQVPVILLDTNVNENDVRDRSITDRLYGGDEIDRIRQEIVLGIGGEKVLRALGFAISTYHLNEGHAAFLALSLLLRYRRERVLAGDESLSYAMEQVREQCVFTTHTPVEAGHDRYDYRDIRRVLGDIIELDRLKQLAGDDRLNMTNLALSLSGYVNGVALRHAQTAQNMFPGYRVRAITNGAHVPTWMHAKIAAVVQTRLPDWAREPVSLVRATEVSAESLWTAHQEVKGELIAAIRRLTGIEMRLDVPLIGFARRMTGYKRADLLFSDVERLLAIHASYPFQIVMAGKAHPRDLEGKALIQAVHASMCKVKPIAAAFLPDYDMAIAAKLVAGTDVWLNSPLPPFEASGTSGMKAAFNGVLNLSVLDGWWVEGWEEGVTGWAIGNDKDPPDAAAHAADLYRKLEDTVLPLYYTDRSRWTWMMKQAIGKIGSVFNSQRMMRRYTTEAYVRQYAAVGSQ
ncbi:MAG: alpha-glucan family phosphorylase [Xanthobacteraceae bacterium]|jgi:starch phosphorylase